MSSMKLEGFKMGSGSWGSASDAAFTYRQQSLLEWIRWIRKKVNYLESSGLACSLYTTSRLWLLDCDIEYGLSADSIVRRLKHDIPGGRI
jgi:hypothetical protein